MSSNTIRCRIYLNFLLACWPQGSSTAGGGFQRTQANFAFVFSTAVILIILFFGYSLPYPVTHTGLLAPLLAVLIASIASGAFIDKVLKPKWFVLLGQSSFALYMFHAPLLMYRKDFGGVLTSKSAWS